MNDTRRFLLTVWGCGRLRPANYLADRPKNPQGGRSNTTRPKRMLQEPGILIPLLIVCRKVLELAQINFSRTEPTFFFVTIYRKQDHDRFCCTSNSKSSGLQPREISPLPTLGNTCRQQPTDFFIPPPSVMFFFVLPDSGQLVISPLYFPFSRFCVVSCRMPPPPPSPIAVIRRDVQPSTGPLLVETPPLSSRSSRRGRTVGRATSPERRPCIAPPSRDTPLSWRLCSTASDAPHCEPCPLPRRR